MYTARIEIHFNARHALDLPGGVSEPLHSHQWKVAAEVASDRLNACGLVMDFNRLKQMLRQIVLPLEQSESINSAAAFTLSHPSTEQLARFIYEQLHKLLPDHVALQQVRVWETPDCSCCYRG